MLVSPFEFKKETLRLLDQRKLPVKEVWVTCRSSAEVFRAIRNMTVRGAPAIGVAAGYGLYLGVKNFKGNPGQFFKKLKKEAVFLKSSRPTGVNLRNILDRIVDALQAFKISETEKLKKIVLSEARKAHKEDIALCREIGRHGAKLLGRNDCVLTHCNAGGLATSGFGTALGVIYAAKQQGKKVSVFADETRPLLQGARLTAWELLKNRVPCTLLSDNMAAMVMRSGRIDCVIVGADRIAANGDTANKIGTYNVAILAEKHGIPFYVAAPGTTFDFKIKTGNQIPIEERNAEEVKTVFGKKIAPEAVRVVNPAFDVTPHALITAFITEAGVLRAPFRRSFKKLKRNYAK